jgi:hypothetical protein
MLNIGNSFKLNYNMCQIRYLGPLHLYSNDFKNTCFFCVESSILMETGTVQHGNRMACIHVHFINLFCNFVLDIHIKYMHVALNMY